MTSVVIFSWVRVCVKEVNDKQSNVYLSVCVRERNDKCSNVWLCVCVWEETHFYWYKPTDTSLNSSCVMYWFLLSSRIARSTRAAMSLLEFFKYQTIHIQANWRAHAHATSNHAVTTSHTRQGRSDHKIFLHWVSYTARVQGQMCSVITNDTMQRNKPSWITSDQKELVQLFFHRNVKFSHVSLKLHNCYWNGYEICTSGIKKYRYQWINGNSVQKNQHV